MLEQLGEIIRRGVGRTTRSLLLLVSLSSVGLASQASAQDAPLGEWVDTINAFSASVSQAAALDNDSILFPGAIGWGAQKWTCLDPTNTNRNLKVWRVTVGSGTGVGTYRAAMDSALAHSDVNTCQVILFPNGGNYGMDTSGGTVNHDNILNVRHSGQTAQGEGANVYDDGGGVFEQDYARGRIREYFYYRHGVLGSGNICQQDTYDRNISSAWSRGSNNLWTAACGTFAVRRLGNLSRNHTVERLLLGEPGADHPTFIHSGGTLPDTSDIYEGLNKVSRVTQRGNMLVHAGHRSPLYGNSDSVTVADQIVYNLQSAYGQLMSNRHIQSTINLFNSIFIPGSATSTGPTRRWAVYLELFDPAFPDTTSLHVAGIRTEQNGYDLTTPIDSLHRGSKRSTSCLVGVDTYPGMCEADGDSIPLGVLTPDTMVTAHSVAASVPLLDFTDARVHRAAQMAGNHRFLTCTGQWEIRRDTVDIRYLGDFQNETGSSSAVPTGSRSYPAPAAGTPCPDADSDGLPDAWVTAQCGTSTCVTAEDTTDYNGYPAIWWYLDGRNTDGSLVGCDSACNAELEGAAGEILPTYGAVDRYVYIVPKAVQSGVNFPDFSPTGAIKIIVDSPAGDSAIVVTCTEQGTPADSATVHDRLVAWNQPTTPTAVALRDYLPGPGVGC